jgi:hypothetical protein
MSEGLISLLLFVAFGAVLLHTMLVALLRSKIAPESQEFGRLFSRARIRGFWVQSLKVKFLLPWAETPHLSSVARRLLVLTQVSALIAVGAIACLILVGLFLASA